MLLPIQIHLNTSNNHGQLAVIPHQGTNVQSILSPVEYELPVTGHFERQTIVPLILYDKAMNDDPNNLN